MRKYVNGVYMDMTEEEIEEILGFTPTEALPTLDERLTTLEQNTDALKIILGVD